MIVSAFAISTFIRRIIGNLPKLFLTTQVVFYIKDFLLRTIIIFISSKSDHAKQFNVYFLLAWQKTLLNVRVHSVCFTPTDKYQHACLSNTENVTTDIKATSCWLWYCQFNKKLTVCFWIFLYNESLWDFWLGTLKSICSTPERSVGILSSPGTSCAYKEPEKMLCKQVFIFLSIKKIEKWCDYKMSCQIKTHHLSGGGCKKYWDGG